MKILFKLSLYVLLLVLSQNLPAQDMKRARKTLNTLAGPQMHGRGYVNNGDKLAANFIAEQYKKYGLRPIGKNYFQPFTLPVNTFPGKVTLQVNGKKLEPGQDFILDATSKAGAGKARVVCLDTLIFSDEKAGKKFLKKNLKKKVLVYEQQQYERLKHLPNEFLEKANQAKAHVALQSGNLVATVARAQGQVPVFEVKKEAWPQQAKQVTFNVEAQFQPQYQTQNVVGYVPGTVYPDSFVVFTAHYDHLGRQGQEILFPGANDNASGTTMLLELANFYTQHPLPYSVAFIAFGAEEAGLVGSFYYTENPLFPLPQISFLVNLDLLGTGDDGLMVVNGKIFTKQFKLLELLNQQHQFLPQIKSRGKAANSDHYPFSEKGVKAFFVYTLGGTAAYHHPQDAPEQLPLTKFREVFQLLTLFVQRLTEVPESVTAAP